MTVYGVPITQEQIDACLAAMWGKFDMESVVDAANIPGTYSARTTAWSTRYRLADRLLQRERKAGRIRWLSAERLWEKREDYMGAAP